ncbi:site-2 protease family protein [Algoriphagus sediminis]|uniref:Site-2 protease family protein n=1 Tax=Algoriphagus sediminis TaxID=3057113 RepID=A0ABT7YA06_9BACT|nr:site-2 protease family protein [Algoriphagus sediminis]MDN3203352.1 site-2 protease family protein [Algoriphagus sediminis]
MYSPKEYLRHGVLLVLTIITTTLAGSEWLFGKSVLGEEDTMLTWEYFWRSTAFSFSFIGILFVHEMGHLLVSIRNRVKSSLPYFIPAWFGFIGAPSIGTLGAVIRMKSLVNSRRKFFDIGIAGPLAGFVVALGVLAYGFVSLPELSYLYEVHPEYADPNFEGYGEDVLNFELGNNLLFYVMSETLADPNRMPEMSEVIHYPYLFAGYLALFFTALNLLPIGQLDGGHVVFGLFPKRHKEISLAAFCVFIGYAGLGVISPFMPGDDLLFRIPLYLGFLYICLHKSGLSPQNKLTLALSIAALQYAIVFIKPDWEGYQGWLFFAFLIGRIMGTKHPEVTGFKELDQKRKVLGWIALAIFILCFSPKPFIFS